MTVKAKTTAGTLARFIVCCISIASAPSGWAQFAGVVPEGVLAVVGAHRSYLDQTKTWNERGQRISLSNRAQLRFDGEHLLRGEGGAELQSLAEELQRYDPSGSPQSLLKRLNLGTLDVGGQAKLNIQYFGLALGLPHKMTFYLAAPLVDLEVKTNFRLQGTNNASELREELGALGYDELRDGLTQAGMLTERDVKASIEAAEYRGVDSWRYRNFADLLAGLAFDIGEPLPVSDVGRMSWQGEAFVSLPTGHVDHPDILSDVSVGSGSWGLGLALTPTLQWSDWTLGLESNALFSFTSKQNLRIPELDETIIPAARRSEADVRPGADWGVTAVLDYKFSWLQPQYRISYKRHERDSIQGRLPGNYSALMNASQKQQWEHSVWIYLSTIDLFREKKFPVPLRLKFAGQQLFKAYRSFENTYFEVQLVSFLPTPWMPD
jgi:hypothetical protein